MASLIGSIKGTFDERKKMMFPEPKGIIEGYTQVFDGTEDYVKNGYHHIEIDLSVLLEKCANIADQYNEPDIFETSPYTFTPPQTLIEYYVAKYLRSQLDKERWNLLFKKPINGVVHDIRLVEKELPQTDENTPKRKQKLRTIIIDLFAELWLFPLFNSRFIQSREAEIPAITLDELVAKIKSKMEASGITPENYFVALIVLPTTKDGEEIDLDELAERLGIPRKNLLIWGDDIRKLFEELIAMIRSLSILFEPEEENINIRKK
ncbi:hypothetical protein [Capnocytophaga leadbetteri]|uniref:hypothetical protein n=1 Tax=Capnocytophaga leadbetteri TaxID=327575 RepID=UPI0026F154DC|nr:hypothetical protein [Capnocytophaga leadbetteri]